MAKPPTSRDSSGVQSERHQILRRKRIQVKNVKRGGKPTTEGFVTLFDEGKGRFLGRLNGSNVEFTHLQALTGGASGRQPSGWGYKKLEQPLTLPIEALGGRQLEKATIEGRKTDSSILGRERIRLRHVKSGAEPARGDLVTFYDGDKGRYLGRWVGRNVEFTHLQKLVGLPSNLRLSGQGYERLEQPLTLPIEVFSDRRLEKATIEGRETDK